MSNSPGFRGGAIGSVVVFRREPGVYIEIGWTIYRRHWNHGYATEAARAALEFAIGTHGADRVVAYTARGNVASARVATKIGMRGRGEADFYGEVAWLYVYEPTPRDAG